MMIFTSNYPGVRPVI